MIGQELMATTSSKRVPLIASSAVSLYSPSTNLVWRMPITERQHGLIHDHVRQWKYGQVGVRSNNCVDLVAEAAAAAGIHLIHRVRLNIPPQVKLLGKTRRVWTDPRYAVLEFSTPDMLEVDLRHLARFGIGRDVAERYLKEMRR